MRKNLKILFIVIIINFLIIGCTNNKTSSIISTTSSELTTTTSPDNDKISFNVSGFASGFISDRSHKNQTDSDFIVVNNELEFLQALNNKTVKVIEIINDLNLGYLELQEKYDLSSFSSIIRSHNKPLNHPTLLRTGVSRIFIKDRNEDKNQKSLMIFSRRGITIKHASFSIERSEDIVFRNLKFDELWEFDESTVGNYDRNDWDYFTIEDCNGVWLDHLEFGKSYDGLIDLKEGSKNVTISWSKFEFEPNDFIYDQFHYLEEHIDNHPMYKYLRDGGLSIEEIVKLYSSQKKGHLIGSSELDESNKNLSLTLHHNVYINLQDRLPRLRAGNVHMYNVILDNTELHKTTNELSRYNSVLDSSLYRFKTVNQGIITTENGAVLMEDSIFKGVRTPVKNNQKNTDIRYTGKYLVINSIYELSTTKFQGGSDESSSPFNGGPAEVIPFSWNGFDNLPYYYQKDDVNLLTELISDKVGIQNTNIDWLKI